MGSIIHWGIRYGIMWGTIQILIFVRDNWVSIVTVVIFAFIVSLGIGFMLSKARSD